jgi:hypothetical protein
MHFNQLLVAEGLATNARSITSPPAPGWGDLVVTAAEIRTLPVEWAARLAEWRGVYLVVDESGGARYVGSGYGDRNLLGRWRAHVAGQRGVKREPAQFRFLILKRAGPDMAPGDVIAVENNWKARLHSVAYGLNAA